MTFQALQDATGLSNKNVAFALNVAYVSVCQWRTTGVRPPESRIAALLDMAKQQQALTEALTGEIQDALIRGDGGTIFVPHITTDEAAQRKGWACADLHNIAARRALAVVPIDALSRVQLLDVGR